MREQTIPKFKPQTGLLPDMLKRTKYSPLRNDSLTSLEDRPERLLPSKRDLCLDSNFAHLDSGTPSPHGSSTLRNFMPRVASIQLQSPNCLRRVLKGQANTIRTVSKRDDRADWSSSLGGSFSSGPDPIHPALLSTKRPITLHRMASLPCASCSQQSDGLCRLKTVDDCAVVRTSNKAVHHHVKYMGSVEVVQSMRTLDVDTRMQVTREAISRLCERTSVKSLLRTKRPPCKGVSAVLGQINMQFSGSRAILTVSTDSLSLITASNLQTIVNHPMQGISFASGGDPDMSDYIAYVAKDVINNRECHIMECPQGRAGEIISTIGQAFETRFRQLLSQTSTLLSPRSVVRICPRWCPKEASMEQKTKQKEEVTEQPDYYNVTTGKNFFSLVGGKKGKQVSKEEKKQEPDIQEVCLSRPVSLHDYSVREETSAPSADSVQCDDSGEQHSPLFDTPVQSLIYQEVWFHGRLDREKAESLLTCSGDFLVRESSSASGQYVLSGMEGATVRHILLVDSHGQVRTRDQVFQSVGHLVQFHMEKQTPIFSGSSRLRLKQPILQSQ
ncbi:SHC-transforming protein 4 [Xiphophorus couchianus]|uniref:SHC-transforming protein 4 n=1 Tax=Xiphophorus couchianus TaxID=32473 RepID=UPI0010160F4D|nr:SHC-transforming protein 4 [Xiphophorus couchianus]XP_027870095.1 SHC-transforming protein 4 [Xiphophorus couchianus]